MKKTVKLITAVTALFLALLLCFSLAACADDTGPSGGGNGDGNHDAPLEEYYVERIEVTTDDTFKTSYYDGEAFDSSGMTVKAYWNDGYTEDNVSSSKYYVVPSIITEGVTEVTVHYGDASAVVQITSFKRELVGLDVLSPPTKTLYIEGEKFDPAGLILRYEYNDGTYETIPDFSASDVTFPDEELTKGQTHVTVTYGDYSVDIPVTVNGEGQIIEMETGTLFDNSGYGDIKKKSQANSDGTPHWMQEYASGGDFVADINEGDAIALSFKMNKATKANLYVQGASNRVNLNPPTIAQDLDLNDVMDVTVNGESLTLPDTAKLPGKDNNGVADKWLWVQWAVTSLGEIRLEEGNNVIRFSFKNPNEYKQPYDANSFYGDAVGQYDYIMLEYEESGAEAVPVTSISATAPTRTEYVEGEYLDKSDITVTATYSDGTSGTVRDFEVLEPFAMGDTTATIGCGGCETVLEGFTVIKRVLTDLRIKTPPAKTVYDAGETFDPEGMVVEAVYNDGKVVEEVTDYTYDTGKLYAGVDKVTIAFGGMSVDQPITVNGDAQTVIDTEVSFAAVYDDGADVSVIKESDVEVYTLMGDGSRRKLTDGYTVELPSEGKIAFGVTTVTVRYTADPSLDKTVPVRVLGKTEITTDHCTGGGADGGNATINPTASGGAYVKNVTAGTKVTFSVSLAAAGNADLILRGSSTNTLKANYGEIGEMQANRVFTLTVNGRPVEIPDSVKFVGKSAEECAGGGVLNLANWCDLVIEDVALGEGENTIVFSFINNGYKNHDDGVPSPYLDTFTVDLSA